jgi:glycosyltransferase involved in cell wall biosynthesis
MPPLFSVIIPTYNRPVETRIAIDSVLSQTYSDFELIVVNDGSTSDLQELKKYAENNSVKWIEIDHLGVSTARNTGIETSKGEWLAFLDSDDRWCPQKLEKQKIFLEENPQYQICQTRERWNRNGKFVNPREIHLMLKDVCFERSLKLCCISPSSVVIKREVFSECGLFDPLLEVCEDYDLWLRITKRHQVGLIEEELVEKFGGGKDQLSKAKPAMDRYRIYAMVKLLLEGELTICQRELVRAEILYKSKVMLVGAIKRENQFAINLYRKIITNCDSFEPNGFRELWLDMVRSIDNASFF